MTMVVQADPVSQEQAMALVNASLNANGQATGYSAKSVEAIKNRAGDTLYYVVYCAPHGYMVVASDDNVEPILAFSDSDTFDKSYKNPLFSLLENDTETRLDVVESITAVQSDDRGIRTATLDTTAVEGLDEFVADARAKWDAIESAAPQAAGDSVEDDPFADVRTGQVVMDFQAPQDNTPNPGPNGGFAPAGFNVWVDNIIQSSWDQGKQYGTFGSDLYNLTTPSNRLAGCGPVAVAQIMKYHQWPRAITLNGVSGDAAVQQADGSIITNTYAFKAGYTNAAGLLSWTNFLNEYKGTSSSLAWTNVSDLLRDVGVAAGATYYTNKTYTTLAGLQQALTNTFRYSRAVLSAPSMYTNRTLNFNILGKKPVVMAIYNSAAPTEGHIVAVDGMAYSAQGTLFHHLNMGWGEVGQNTAWYNLPSIIAYNSIEGYIFNIMTNGEELVVGRVVDSASGAVMSNAIVLVNGVTNFTDGYGVFGDETVAGVQTVTVSKVGYVSQTFVVTNATSTGTTLGDVYKAISLVKGGDMVFTAMSYSSNIVLTWSNPAAFYYPASIQIIATTNAGGAEAGYSTYWTNAQRRTEWFSGYVTGGRTFATNGSLFPSNRVFNGDGSAVSSVLITNLPLNVTYYFKLWCSNEFGYVNIENGISTAQARPDANNTVLYCQETSGLGRAFYAMPAIGQQASGAYNLKA
ncbi:MAG: C10 family peptidase, partial [Lentisphaerota bacterium]